MCADIYRLVIYHLLSKTVVAEIIKGISSPRRRVRPGEIHRRGCKLYIVLPILPRLVSPTMSVL